LPDTHAPEAAEAGAACARNISPGISAKRNDVSEYRVRQIRRQDNHQEKHQEKRRASAMLEVVPCQSCAGPTTFTTEMQPLGNEPGHRVYYCEACRRYTWTTWRITRERQPEKEENGTG
jgi:hypothetical protein